ncbi:hypothetical protein EB093_04005 [bacterium]|nr:hypothetical protein [bacterium]
MYKVVAVLEKGISNLVVVTPVESVMIQAEFAAYFKSHYRDFLENVRCPMEPEAGKKACPGIIGNWDAKFKGANEINLIDFFSALTAVQGAVKANVSYIKTEPGSSDVIREFLGVCKRHYGHMNSDSSKRELLQTKITEKLDSILILIQ